MTCQRRIEGRIDSHKTVGDLDRSFRVGSERPTRNGGRYSCQRWVGVVIVGAELLRTIAPSARSGVWMCGLRKCLGWLRDEDLNVEDMIEKTRVRSRARFGAHLLRLSNPADTHNPFRSEALVDGWLCEGHHLLIPSVLSRVVWWKERRTSHGGCPGGDCDIEGGRQACCLQCRFGGSRLTCTGAGGILDTSNDCRGAKRGEHCATSRSGRAYRERDRHYKHRLSPPPAAFPMNY